MIIPIADKTNIRLVKSAVPGLAGVDENASILEISQTKATVINKSQLVFQHGNHIILMKGRG